ncbi:isochorismatase family protein [Pelagibius sp.]|uniref:isochorismatase family protein n=1 Tax=Pelagibius sp. TaxID=1931238 RepID=UPI00262189BA|nr:isochorismatase family protein [Pelagibius sp.]
MPDSADQPSLTRDLAAAMPVAPVELTLGAENTGLVIVDEVNGFATVGAGNLAPPAPNAQVSTMVAETDRLARAFTGRSWPILAFLDTHVPGKPEPPYPPHCEAGTGEEDLVPELAWLEQDPNTTLVRKDCINGFVGAIRPDGSNAVVDWVNSAGLQRVLVVGICTDICVMDFVLTLLSARNHDLMPSLRDISVYADGCSTYDLPLTVAESLGLPKTAAHPQDLAHHMGLYFMASRGAEIAGRVTLAG